MSEHTTEEKREAFVAWDRYRPELERTITEMTGIAEHSGSISHNPMVSIIYADGYLAGKRSMDAIVRASREVVAAIAAVLHETQTYGVQSDAALERLGRAVAAYAELDREAKA